MKKQNPRQYTRCIDNSMHLYYLHDDNINILVRLIDYQIHIFNASVNLWFNTGYMVTPQANQTRSIMRAWSTYLKKIYYTEKNEIYINMEIMS